MKGYVLNASTIWTHAMKRSIGPGAKVPLNELFEQYGVKHELREGQEFAEWLRNVKLKDTTKWKIVFEDDEEEVIKVEDASDEVSVTSNVVVGGVAPIVKTEMEIKDIVSLSVRNAREQLPKIMDLKLLKYALQEANQLAGKDSLCKVIRKRIRDLQIAR